MAGPVAEQDLVIPDIEVAPGPDEASFAAKWSDRKIPQAAPLWEYLKLIREATSPARQRSASLSKQDRDRAARFQARLMKLLDEAQGDEKKVKQLEDLAEELADRFVKKHEIQQIERLTKAMLEAHPDLKGVSREELKARLEEAAELIAEEAGKTSREDCQGWCTASYLTAVAVIEATWAGALVGCTATTLAYPVCAGIATGIKYGAIIAASVDFAGCSEACEREQS